MLMKKNVIIYRDHLLPQSETFIKGQAESLVNFIPYYVGARLVNGLTLPSDKTIVVNRNGFLGFMKEAMYKLFQYAPSFYKKVDSLNPVLVHAHFGPDAVWAIRLVEQRMIPLIVTFHGYDATVKDDYAKRSFYSHRRYIRRRSELQKKAHLFIAVSKFIKEQLLEQGYPEENTIVHYIGIDTQYFTFHESVKREPVVLFVGRLIEKKGCEFLIRAIKEVQIKKPEVQLVIIGDGPLKQNLFTLASKTITNFKFLGAQDSHVVREWMARAKVFCVPSIIAQSGDAEALGIVFAESQAIGTPVVSFESGGIPEIVKHNQTGLLSKERDWKDLAKNILLLLENEQLWQKFRIEGRKFIEINFDLKRQTAILEDVYLQVIKKMSQMKYEQEK